jgi:hypothetical protein
MYRVNETDLSRRYLEELFTVGRIDAYLIGGWAVYLTVNEGFSRAKGFNYIGSRDIDIGFIIGSELNADQLRSSELSSTLGILKRLGFAPVSFRHLKYYDYDTLNELGSDELSNKASFEVFSLSIDIVVDEVPENFVEVFGFNPIDEPLLKLAKNVGMSRTLDHEGIRVRSVSPELLLAMKIRSLPSRTQDHKRVKDILDIYALSLFSGIPFKGIKGRLHSIVTQNDVEKSLRGLRSEHYIEASRVISEDWSQVRLVLEDLGTAYS